MKKYLILTGLLILGGCSSTEQQQKATRSVKTEAVAPYGQSASATFPGKVVAASDIGLAFRVGGPIRQVNVQAGSYVRKGQVLAEIDPRDYEVQLAATRAQYRQIKNDTERITALFEKGSVTPSDYDKAVYGLEQIAARLDAHTHALGDTKLTAPCDGYIQKRLFEPGETVNTGMPVLTMISAGAGEVEINIPSSDYIRRDQFASYYCTVDVFPDKTFPLELVGITRKANMNQLYTMRFRLTGEEKHIPGPGMSTLVTIRYKPENTATVSVPLTAVFDSGEGPAVWIYNASGGTVSERRVKVSQILTDGTVVVSSGLREGETVVTAGVHSLQEGEQVRLLPEVSPTNVGGML